ncbi:MAG: type II toxin-antitoxin system VapC family toxin [Verrucomicrobia bacterium]|nr:type II toxin-antitoxin system VapC family toxin [Verrucomicrobiota bacterium]
MRFLLDTNVLSELTKPSPSPRLVEWVGENQDASAISTITIGELIRGVEYLPDGKKKNRLRTAVRFFLQDYRDRLLAFDEWVAATWGRHCARVRAAGLPLSILDSQIAATALHYELQVVTANAAHFPLVVTVNPFRD